MPSKPTPPDDPLLALIREEAARIDDEDVRLDLDDPAFQALVDDAVAPFEGVLTTAGIDEARHVATIALATHPGIEQRLERRRAQLPPGTGARPRRSPARLLEAERKRLERAKGSR